MNNISRSTPNINETDFEINRMSESDGSNEYVESGPTLHQLDKTQLSDVFFSEVGVY